MSKEKERQRELIRFRCSQKRSRKPDHGDPVVNRGGEEIGQITSCSVGEEGCLVGLAILDKNRAVPGTELEVLSLRAKSLQEGLSEKANVSTRIDIIVLERFPEKTGQLPPWLLGGD